MSRRSEPSDFMARLSKSKGCWEWTGALQRKGYGILTYQGKFWLAHRLAYQIMVGELRDDLQVCHTCDNPRCCRPSHLFLGTPQDNVDDMMSKGRHRAIGGANHHRSTAKLTPTQIKEIRSAYKKGGVTQSALGAKYGVIQQSIQLIVTGKIWKHV